MEGILFILTGVVQKNVSAVSFPGRRYCSDGRGDLCTSERQQLLCADGRRRVQDSGKYPDSRGGPSDDHWCYRVLRSDEGEKMAASVGKS